MNVYKTRPDKYQDENRKYNLHEYFHDTLHS